MTETSIGTFSHAAQQAQQWVNELAAELGWNERRAHHLLKAVLTALRDWLSPEEAADLSAQLPTFDQGYLLRRLESLIVTSERAQEARLHYPCRARIPR